MITARVYWYFKFSNPIIPLFCRRVRIDFTSWLQLRIGFLLKLSQENDLTKAEPFTRISRLNGVTAYIKDEWPLLIHTCLWSRMFECILWIPCGKSKCLHEFWKACSTGRHIGNKRSYQTKLFSFIFQIAHSYITNKPVPFRKYVPWKA